MRIGFVGLGVMGGRIAKRLLDAGHTVAGYNRTPAKAARLLDAGLQLAPTPRVAAEGAEIVFSMVADQDALLATTGGPDGILAGLGEGTVYADMTTVHPQVSCYLAAQASARNASVVDAPVMGSVPTFERDLPLIVMVGGDLVAYEQLRIVLDTINTQVFHIGANGQALRLKAAFNLTLPVHLAAFAEGLLVAEKGGIPRETVCEVFAATGAASDAIRMRMGFFAELPAEPYFAVDGMQKDVQIALELGHHAGVPMMQTAAVNQLLTTCRGLGMATEDFAAIYHAMARISQPSRPLEA